jgi:hypothetical protein
VPPHQLSFRSPEIPTASLVHGIIDGATEVPHGNDCTAFVGWKHQKRVVEIGVTRHSLSAPGDCVPGDNSDIGGSEPRTMIQHVVGTLDLVENP